MGVLTTKKKKKDTTRKTGIVLKVIHPRGYTEVFRVPIPAREIMRRHPRYCVARPDVFQFPWIVVRPESVLVPGEVFYLVPYVTLGKLMKAKRQQGVESTTNGGSYIYHELGSERSHYKLMFYKAWDEVKRNLQSVDSVDLGIDSAVDGGKSLCVDSELKSCLSKPESSRKRLNMKVRFEDSVSED